MNKRTAIAIFSFALAVIVCAIYFCADSRSTQIQTPQSSCTSNKSNPNSKRHRKIRFDEDDFNKEATLHLSDRHTKLFKKDEEHGGQAHISTCSPFLKAFINYKAIEIKATTKSCAKSPIFILFLKILI